MHCSIHHHSMHCCPLPFITTPLLSLPLILLSDIIIRLPLSDYTDIITTVVITTDIVIRLRGVSGDVSGDVTMISGVRGDVAQTPLILLSVEYYQWSQSRCRPDSTDISGVSGVGIAMHAMCARTRS